MMPAFGLAAQASILNDQEQAIASSMMNDSGQKRPFLKLDPILAGVARARAKDMARRNYFSHVNPDGLAANYLVRQAGYVLPDWWGTSPTDNYIESIAAGYSTPQKAWEGWMNSTGHRTHILGLDPFYTAETSYGVGYYYDASSTYKHYWVVLTAPPMPEPKLVITTPANGTQVTTPGLDVVGTSNDPDTALVEVRIETSFADSHWLPATGIATWSVKLSPFPQGASTIRARGLNAAGEVIAEVTCDVNYLEMGLLDIRVSGSGSVIGGLTGTSSQQVGKSLTISATPAPGNVFAGWSGDVASKSATLTFTMQKSLTLQANFTRDRFPDLRGLYVGLIATGSNDHNGFVRITSGPTGVFSGRFQLDGTAYGFRGQFGVDGRATVTLQRPGANPLVLNLQLAFAEGANEISGTISDGVFTAAISADRAVFNAKTKPAPQAGNYTVVLASNPNFTAPGHPQGNGFANVRVSAGGSARIAGLLGDGTPFTRDSMVAQDGVLPVYAPLYSTKGSLAGALTFRATSVSDLDGTLNWTKPPRSWDLYYRAGFAMTVPAVGSLYKKPAAGARLMDLPSGFVALGAGNLNSAILLPMTLSTANRITLPLVNPQMVSFTLNTLSGMIVGKFAHPGDNKLRTIRCVVLQKQKCAYGFFNGVDQYGYMSMSSTPTSN